MAQLPPRAPSAVEQDWPVAGEFLGFAAARRGVHRRSASDPAAFLEAVPMDHILSGGGGDDEFDRLDDEQLMSMFSNVDGGCDRPGFMDTGEAEEGTASAGAMAAADGFGDPKRVKRSVTFASKFSFSCEGGKVNFLRGSCSIILPE